MSSKFERDVVGAGSILAELFAGDNPAVREATEHLRRKVGCQPGFDTEPPAHGPDHDDEPTHPRVVVGATAPGGTGNFFFAVFFEDGAYSGRAFTSPYQAAQFAEGCEGAAFIRKLRASDLPEG